MPGVHRQRIDRRRQRVVPWRNGGGSTREVAIEPATATAADGFLWRVSCAVVGTDGPFSLFPAVDRSLWLLRGRGIELSIDGSVHRLETRFARLDFAGERTVCGRLLAGPIEDCNVMTRRGAVRAQAEVARPPTGGTRRHAIATPGTTLVLALTEAAHIDGDALAAGDALRIEHTTELALSIADGPVLIATFVAGP